MHCSQQMSAHCCVTHIQKTSNFNDSIPIAVHEGDAYALTFTESCERRQKPRLEIAQLILGRCRQLLCNSH